MPLRTVILMEKIKLVDVDAKRRSGRKRTAWIATVLLAGSLANHGRRLLIQLGRHGNLQPPGPFLERRLGTESRMEVLRPLITL